MTSPSLESQLRDDGFCRIDNVIPPAAILDCYYDAYRVLETCGIIAPSYPRNMTWQLRALELMEDVVNPSRTDEILAEQFYIRPAVANDMQSFTPYLADSRLAAIVAALLGGDPRVTFTTLCVHEPGTKRGLWHASGPFNPDYAAHYPSPYPDAATHLTAHLLLADFSEETGGIRAVPGSHRRPSNPGYQPREKRFETYADETELTGAAGSVVVMDSRLWHAAAPNESDFPRVSIVVEYAPSDQSLPPFLARAKAPSMPPAIFHRLLPSVQPLFRQWGQSR